MKLDRKKILLVIIISMMSFVILFVLADISNVLTPIPLDPFIGIKGGSWLGYRFGYYGTLIITISLIYSIVKRLNPKQQRNIGGLRLWFTIHIWLSIIGSLMILTHAGFPFDFKYYDPLKYIRLTQGGLAGFVGTAGIASLIIPFLMISGFIGRYLYTRSEGRFLIIFRYWHLIHIILTSVLFVTGSIHLILVVWFKFLTI
jgi:hypothetical protein